MSWPFGLLLQQFGDRQAREEHYRRIERALLEELPLIPVGFPDPSRRGDAFLYRTGVRGFADPTTHLVPPAAGPPFVHIWIDG